MRYYKFEAAYLFVTYEDEYSYGPGSFVVGCNKTEFDTDEQQETGRVQGRIKAFVVLSEDDENKAYKMLCDYYNQHIMIMDEYTVVDFNTSVTADKYGVVNVPALAEGLAVVTFTVDDIVEISCDKEALEYDTAVRRPYYQLRGKPVTEEQAIEIIRRFDSYLDAPRDYVLPDDALYATNFNMWWLMDNHIPTHYGWVHPDGTVGINAITQKYPTLKEYISEWTELVHEFPFLDLIAAVTVYNEFIYQDCTFEEGVEIGIWVHEGRVEFLNRENTLKVYNEYAEKYAVDERLYEPDTCYKYQNIDIADYRRRCSKLNRKRKAQNKKNM